MNLQQIIKEQQERNGEARIKPFYIEFKKTIDSDPEMMSGLRELVNETTQQTAEAVLQAVREKAKPFYFTRDGVEIMAVDLRDITQLQTKQE